jgi:hypothetical protein
MKCHVDVCCVQWYYAVLCNIEATPGHPHLRQRRLLPRSHGRGLVADGLWRWVWAVSRLGIGLGQTA